MRWKITSTIASIKSESGIDICDRWQSQYADTILSPQEISTKPALSSGTKIVSVTQSSFYNINTPKKVCCCCSKPMSTSFIQDNLSYCKECHLKLFNKGQCPTCRKPISDRDAWIEHDTNIWHADCFTCFSCKIPLDTNPLIDLQRRPCCETCFNGQSGASRMVTRKKVPTVVTTPLSPITTPSPTKSATRYDSYSSQSSMSSSGSVTSESSQPRSTRRPRIDRELFHQPAIVTPPRTPSPAATEESKVKKRIPSPTKQLNTVHTTPSPSQSMNSVSNRPCHYCHKALGDSSQKKIKIPIGDGLFAWFHKSCFLCSKCHLPFQDGQCATDGHSFYHAQCQVSQGCYGCKKQVQKDAFQFNEKMYHFECFKCCGNGCKLSMGQPIFEVANKPYCKLCYDINQSTTTLVAEVLPQQPQAPRTTRVFPKLGGSKTCPRCQHSISVMDDTPGPFTSRWHKKCLACANCNKQLDSAAKTKSGQQGQSLVFCQKCY
ncbi:hypothetical protein EDC94DRAFT_72278 [Helicostylum pulchrum]|nr:hypothetical protein EDC94DRAFT_72278 [Helicostylum pulchrum]